MISISSITENLSGNVLFNNTEECSFQKNTSRVSRSATLDGGSVISNYGVTDGDRVFSLNVSITENQYSKLKNIFSVSPLVLISCSEGIFFGALQYFSVKNDVLTGKILIQNKEN